MFFTNKRWLRALVDQEMGCTTWSIPVRAQPQALSPRCCQWCSMLVLDTYKGPRLSRLWVSGRETTVAAHKLQS